MTYRELLDEIHDLEEDQMEMDVMALVDEEFYPIRSIDVQDKDSSLKDGHPFLEVT